uniref:NADH-ubiquinone oxidoreductase chain 5 n=1 Tax=Scyra compressipes TaxID=1235674 RepID=A0A891SCP0_9EUCA|nr:NADH dehydrogenase subunit 5 [Scyra compressipes]QRM82005.1 NADH dehydrogenase subunit 5 [Scyra compressipes]
MVWSVLMHEMSMFFLLMSSLLSGGLSVKSLMDLSACVVEWEFFSLNSCCMTFTLVLDWVSLMFMSFVFLISSSVMFYSGSYMSGDKNINRFMYLVLMFVGSMSLMVLSPNLVSILLGWDGLGLISYALVIFYQNEKSASAGMLTILSNRVGDIGILLSIAFMMKLGGWNFFLYSFYMNEEWIMLKMLVILSAMTKSAQIPFSAWLPAAMAAPTPVSALVHSSTLVTAGVYLMIRFSPALESSMSEKLLLIISCLTMFMAGLGANFEYDLKKIIALSTLSQLGLMLSILSLGFPDLAFFHLLAHALFKALLFMCAGVVIHSVGDYQDIRCMGGLINFMPLTVSFMVVANLALCGFPFLAGFYSKDMILEMAFMSAINFIILLLFIVSTMFTVMYTMRLLYYTLTSEFNLGSLSNVSDEDYIMTTSMSGLGLGGILGGSILSWMIFPESFMICMSMSMKMTVLVVSIFGGILGYLFNMNKMTYNLKSMNNYKGTVMVGSMWFMPFLSTKKMSEISLNLGQKIQKVGDKGWYEYFGGQGLNKVLGDLYWVVNELQINSIKVFMKMFVISVILVLVVM